MHILLCLGNLLHLVASKWRVNEWVGQVFYFVLTHRSHSVIENISPSQTKIYDKYFALLAVQPNGKIGLLVERKDEIELRNWECFNWLYITMQITLFVAIGAIRFLKSKKQMADLASRALSICFPSNTVVERENLPPVCLRLNSDKFSPNNSITNTEVSGAKALQTPTK